MRTAIVGTEIFHDYTPKVAKSLLGCFLVREHKGKLLRGMITETEAYRGKYDLACHAAKGLTGRTKVMFGPPGHAYVYLVYGMHWMLNVVTEKEGFPAAVLIRSIESSIEATTGSSNFDKNKSLSASFEKGKAVLFNGPGKLTKFLQVGKSLNGHDLTKGEKLWIEMPSKKPRFKIKKSPRIGVDYARHCKDWKWNFKLIERSPIPNGL